MTMMKRSTTPKRRQHEYRKLSKETEHIRTDGQLLAESLMQTKEPTNGRCSPTAQMPPNRPLSNWRLSSSLAGVGAAKARGAKATARKVDANFMLDVSEWSADK